MPDPHDRFDLFDGVFPLDALAGRREDEHRGPAALLVGVDAELLLEGGVGNQRQRVLVRVEAAEARLLRGDADDGEQRGADPHALSDRIDVLEERLVRRLPEDDDGAPVHEFVLGEVPPGRELEAVDVRKLLARAPDLCLTRARALVEQPIGVEEPEIDGAQRPRLARQGLRVVDRQVRPPVHLLAVDVRPALAS